jgi:xylulokinase
LDLPIHTHPHSEAGAALGAARLAQMACGANESKVCLKPGLQAEFLPQSATAAMLSGRLTRFRELYAAVKPQFKGKS